MKVLVSGGGGFLGRAIVERLLAGGHAVRSLARQGYPELERLGVEALRGDVADPAAARAAVEGVELVIHTAAKAGVWGRRSEYWRSNVEGTRVLLEAAQRAGVGRFVHTSSPSVCFDGSDHRMAGRELPYARSYLAAYPESKAVAERAVLAASSPSFATCALRPHLILGPRDPHLLPRLLSRARSGRLAVVGDGTNEVSWTWIENAAQAHVEAGLRLEPSAHHAGRAYFIAQEEPVQLWPWIAGLLEELGLPKPRRRISTRAAYAAGALCEGLWQMVGARGDPPMTRFTALQLATSHTYDMEPAKREFGYKELVSVREATRRLVAHYQSQGAAASSRRRGRVQGAGRNPQ